MDLKTCLKFGPKWQFLMFKPILVAIFVTIATLKVKQIPEFYTRIILLIKQKKLVKATFSFWLQRGPN